MAELKGSNTLDNLKAAFAGESERTAVTSISQSKRTLKAIQK